MDNKEIISRYLREKDNEDVIIALLQEQKTTLENSFTLNNEDLSLIIKLAKNSKGQIKYLTLSTLSKIKLSMDAKNFYELCRIAADSLKNKEGDIRRAASIIIKNLNASMIIIPFINKARNASEAEINLFYESFRNLFIKSYLSFYNGSDPDIRKSILRSLAVMLPRFYDMAKFWDDNDEMSMANKIREEISKGIQHGNRD